MRPPNAHAGLVNARLLLPLAIITALVALFASGLAHHADAAGDSTVRVDNASLNGWAFVDDNGAPTAPTMEMVAGPGVPPLGSGSAHLAISSSSQGPFLYTSDFAGTDLDAITALSFSTYSASPTCCGRTVALDMDVDFDSSDGDHSYQGRLNFLPVLTGATSADTWQTWDTVGLTTPAWWTSHSNVVVGGVSTPSNCTESSPCTWAQVLTFYPYAQITGNVGFKAGSAYSFFDGNVDAFTIGVNGTNTTYNFEVAPTCTTCYVNGVTGNDNTGDGSPANPFATIQRGVDVVGFNEPGGGGSVVVAAGTYNESVSIDSPMTLEGAGYGQDARTYTGPQTIVTSGANLPAFWVDSSDVTVDGFRFTNSGAGIFVDNGADIDNLTIQDDFFFNNSGGLLIAGAEVTGLTVQYNVFYWNNLAGPAPITGVGIGIADAQVAPYEEDGDNSSLITDNTFTGNKTGAFVMQDGAVAIGLEITNNTSTGDGSFAVLTGTVFGLISGNTVTQPAGDAIVIGPCSGIIYIGYDPSQEGDSPNVIYGGGGAAIAETGAFSGDLMIGFNTFSANQYGINFEAGNGDGTQVQFNTFASNRKAGINVTSDFDADGLLVEQNSFTGNKAGVVNKADEFDATCNWWNATSGPRINTNPGGSGDSIVGLSRENYAPWLISSDLESDCDHTAPEVTITAPAATNYARNERVTPVYSCTDADSGIASCTAYVNTGSSYNAATAKAGYYFSTSKNGTFTYTVIAIDKAGNTSQQSVTYTVGAPT